MSITVREAGKKGGLTTLARRGHQFFAEIGKGGNEALRRKYPGMASKWGKMGGRPRKLKLSESMEQEGKQS